MSVVFIFRRDLRLQDNIGLHRAYEYAKQNKLKLHGVFIFNEAQITPQKNKYFGANTVRFFIECIDNDLRDVLNIYHTNTSDLEVLERLKPSAVFFNRDYTPFARRRDDEITSYCQSNKIHVHGEWNEYALVNIPEMPKPYRMYGAFYEAYKTYAVPQPIDHSKEIRAFMKPSKLHRDRKDITQYYNQTPSLLAPLPAFLGGREHALKRLELIKNGAFDNYEHDREYPSLSNGTTNMSSYLKSGCISIREAYHVLKSRLPKSETIIKELFWRTYYEQITYWFPHTLDGQIQNDNYNISLNPKSDMRKWTGSQQDAQRIIEGRTGIPAVDAAVAQLVQTGYMHNRMRMVVCMLASRILNLDWRIFERWFAQHLIDYYPSANSGGWQWSMSYRFVLNPWVQQKKFDPDALYIKQWLPDEYNNIPIKDIHTWHDAYAKYNKPKPIIGRKLP